MSPQLSRRPVLPWMNALPPVLLAAFVLLPLGVQNAYYLHLFSLAAIFMLVVSGLNLVTGFTGQVSLGHAALIAVGAYTSAILTLDYGWSFWLAMPVAATVAAGFGLLLAYPALRVTGPHLALITIAFNLLMDKLILAMPGVTGAAAGKWNIPAPAIGGQALGNTQMYMLCITIALLAVWVCRNLLHSRWGRAWNAIRNDEQVAQVSGIGIRGAKIAAFVLSAVFAGIGGSLWAHLHGGISPEGFGLDLSIMLVLMLLVGGQRTVYGPVIGAILLTALPEVLTSIEEYRLLLFGVALVLLVVFMPEGVAGILKSRLTRPAPAESVTGDDDGIAPLARPASPIEVRDITKRFRGVAAVDCISVLIRPGTVHSMIGPNGAGKSTTVNLVTGVLRPDSGAVHHRGERIDGLAPDEVTRLGIGRIFQNVRVFGDMTVAENVMAGRHCRMHSGLLSTALRLPSVRREERKTRERALRLLRLVNLAHLANEQVSALSYGQQHMVEIARALMSDPEAIFLDEPAAGLNAEEIAELSHILARMKASGLTVFLIEHYVEFVMRVSDEVTVIDFGRRIAGGTPREVSTDPRVIEAYLGARDDEDAAAPGALASAHGREEVAP